MRRGSIKNCAPQLRRAAPRFSVGAYATLLLLACSGGGGDQGQVSADGGFNQMTPPAADDASSMQTHTPPPDAGAGVDASMMMPPAADDASMPPGPSGDAGAVVWDGGAYPPGWLYTTGGKIYLSNGGSAGTPWMGRGVNVDDIFLCGNNNSLAMKSADATLEKEISGLMSGWKPTFIRISLGMNSYTVGELAHEPGAVQDAHDQRDQRHRRVSQRSCAGHASQRQVDDWRGPQWKTPRRRAFRRIARPHPTRRPIQPARMRRTSRSSTRSRTRAS